MKNPRDLESRVIDTVRDWFAAEQKQQRSQIGLSNATLKLAEVLREHFPLELEHYASKRGSQVGGLSGRSGDRIIARFMPGARPLGTEAGRTSRGVLPAITRLAERLNGFSDEIGHLDANGRGQLANAVQRWMVQGPVRQYFAADKLEPDLDARRNASANVSAILASAQPRGQLGQVAQHLVGAKLALRFPEERIDNHSYSTADVPTGRHGDFLVRSTVFHVTAAVSQPLIKKCRKNLREGYRVVILVPDARREGAAQLIATENLADRVTVTGIESFVGQNLEEVARFDQAEFERQLCNLLEIYNERVTAAEPDPSLVIAIPAKLGGARQ